MRLAPRRTDTAGHVVTEVEIDDDPVTVKVPITVRPAVPPCIDPTETEWGPAVALCGTVKENDGRQLSPDGMSAIFVVLSHQTSKLVTTVAQTGANVGTVGYETVTLTNVPGGPDVGLITTLGCASGVFG
jgi:hypothetical protein